jgi:hypothetical protein
VTARRSPRPGLSLALAALLALAYLALAASGPQAVGAWQDDAIYLATAKSLAEGRGYRHAEIPGEPLQAKYPILYPAVLAGLWRLWPDYPRNLPLLLLPGAVAAAALIVLFHRTLRREPGLPARAPLALAGLAALSPELLSMLRFTMSDLPYAALALAALALLDDLGERGGRAAAGPGGRLALCALLVAASVLTRSIGLTLLPGALAFLLWRRRYREALWLAALVALLLAPWLWRQASAQAQNAASFGGTLLVSELDYQAWRPRSLAQPLRVGFQNLFKLAFGLPYFELGLPPGFALRALEAWSWRTALLHALGTTSLALVLLGFAGSARRGASALHFCAVPYALAVLAYPGDPYRFLLPWAPFLLFLLFAGLWRAAPHLRLPPRAAAGALYALLAALFLAEAWRIAASDEDRYHFRLAPRSWRELRALEDWVRAETSPRDVIASGDFAALYLATGRQGYYLWPILDPYTQLYGPDRRWGSFFVRADPAAGEALDRETRELLLEAYREARVDWYVDNGRPDLMTEAVRRFAAAHPGHFQPRFTTPGREYRVYRVRIP